MPEESHENVFFDLDDSLAHDFEPRCPVMLVLDVSRSMEGRPVAELQTGLRVFADYLNADPLSRLRVEVGIITFGGDEGELYDFIQAQSFVPPELVLGSTTPLGYALLQSLEAIKYRVRQYREDGRSYYRPWIFLITDGSPTDEWLTAANRIKEAERAQELFFFAVGVGEADMEVLNALSLRSAKRLEGLEFSKLFRWVSQGLISVSHSGSSDSVRMPQDDWSELY